MLDLKQAGHEARPQRGADRRVDTMIDEAVYYEICLYTMILGYRSISDYIMVCVML